MSVIKFKRLSADERQAAMINAALELIAEQGLAGTTVRAIAARAGVTPGLIRHYFASKQDLIAAAFEYHMSSMTQRSQPQGSDVSHGALHQLAAFIYAALTSPVVGPQSLTIWAAFLQQVSKNDALRRVHQETYHGFRNALQVHLHAAFGEMGRTVDPIILRQLAIACNAVIDGLWLEGGALPDDFGQDELPALGLRAIGAIVDMDLCEIAKLGGILSR